MKKIISAILLITIFFSLLPLDVSAYSKKPENIYKSSDNMYSYTLSGGNAEIVEYFGTETEVIVPENINGHIVTKIGKAAFYDSDMESIIIPSTVTEIGWWAFYGCPYLSNVEFEDGLRTIEFGAFINCPKLMNVSIPYTVTKIGDDAFGVSCSTDIGVYDKKSGGNVNVQHYIYSQNFTLSGYSGTVSEKYCSENNLKFESIGTVKLCDVDLDGKIDDYDIKMIRSFLDEKNNYNDEQFRNCDVDLDGEITENDYQYIESCIKGEISIYSLPAAENLGDECSNLEGLSLYCGGDSVSVGAYTNIFGESHYSYADYLAETYNMTLTKNGRNGTTIAKNDDSSYDMRSIMERTLEMTGDYDVILLDGGFNDLFQDIEVGKVTPYSDRSGNYDVYTTAGALETICYFLNENYKDSVKLFVLAHTRYVNENQYVYWDVIRDVLKKWDIDCIDLSEETDYSDINKEISDQYFAYTKETNGGDGTHPNKYSFQKIYGPLIAERLSSLTGVKKYYGFEYTNLELGLLETYEAALNGVDNLQAVWESSNTDVAIVNNGVITPVSVGTTTITAIVGEKEYSIDVTVKMQAIALFFNTNSVTLNLGDSYNLESTVLMGTAAYYRYYSSSNEDVIKISDNTGEITAVGRGVATVKCTTINGVTAYCKIIVN